MRLLLSILIAMLMAQSANAQALWRNFFTTNQNPIVEVVAGSNATVQASTVGVNLRRFTVNAIPGGTAPVQTNISWTAVTNLQSAQVPYTVITNAPWQIGDSDLTNWATLNTNVLSTLGQTNISLSAVTNANYLTNWATIDTNTYVVKTGDTVSGPILTTSSTSNNPSATELVTANWVRNLFNSGADYYNTTNIDSTATNVGSAQPVYKFQSTIPISDARSYTTADFLTNGGYIGSVITTNTFSQISGAALVTAFLGFTGGVGGPTLTLHPEIYYSYDKTNWYGDWSASDESVITGTTNIYQWAISIPVTTSTNVNGFYISRRFKVTAVTGAGVRTLTVLIGTNSVSGPSTAGHVTMESPTATAGNAFLANNQVFTGSNYFTQPLTLSLATNTPSASQVLTATSASSAAWQDNVASTQPNPRQFIQMFDHFVQYKTPGSLSGINNGGAVPTTIGYSVQTPGANGVVRLSTSTSATGVSSLGTEQSATISVKVLQPLTNEWRFSFGNLPDASEPFHIRLGFQSDGFSAASTPPADGAYLKIMTNGAGGILVDAVTRSNNVETATATGFSVSAATWYVLNVRIDVNTNAVFSLGTTSTNLSTIITNSTSVPINRPLGFYAYIGKTAGTTARVCDVDYFLFGMSLSALP